MLDRTKILVHLRQLSGLFEHAFSYGPDSVLGFKNTTEQEVFIHHGCAFYLAGCFAYLEGEDGAYSWQLTGAGTKDFDDFVTLYPEPPKNSFLARGINKESMNALAEVRNAVVHNDGDLGRNRNIQSCNIVQSANIPGVRLSGCVVMLEAPFLEYVRIATLSVRNYHGEY